MFGSRSQLSDPEAIAGGTAALPANAGLLLTVIYVAAALLGTAEVFRDNAAQTLLPSIVDKEHLETATAGCGALR